MLKISGRLNTETNDEVSAESICVKLLNQLGVNVESLETYKYEKNT